MAECPWCHATVVDLRKRCPKCGKLAADLRTTDPAEAGSDKNATRAAADVPDLVIPTAPMSKPNASVPSGDDDFVLDLGGAEPPKPAAAPPPSAPSSGGGFSPFDDEDLASGPSLELDVEPSAPSAPLPPAPVSQRAVAPAPAPEPQKPSVDRFEAKAFADYGPAPPAFWHTPLYAYRVVTRRAALRRDLLAKKIEAEHTAKRLEDALVALGERARSLAKGAAALERVREAEELLRSRDGALAGTMDAHRAALGEIDSRLSPAESELARAREEEGRLAAARDAADDDQKRADAKLKRLEIEIRNGATGKAQEREGLAQDAAQKAQKRAAADDALAGARRAVAAAQAKVDAIAGERRAQDARFSRQSGTRNAGVEDAQSHLRAALVELGRAALTDPALAAELAHARDEVARLEEHVQKQSQQLALHESALTAYDAPQVFLGIALVALAVVILLVLVFFPFIYRSFAT